MAKKCLGIRRKKWQNQLRKDSKRVKKEQDVQLFSPKPSFFTAGKH
jgi:hypothetical protein